MHGSVLFCFFALLLILTEAQMVDVVNRERNLMNFSPNLHERNFIVKCLNETLNHFQSGENEGKCREMRSRVAQMSDKTARNRIRRETSDLEFEYISRIVDIRNRQSETNDIIANEAILDMVAPCSKFFPSLERKWNRFFQKRTKRPHPRGFTLTPASQSLDHNMLHVSFNRPNFTTHVMREYLLYNRIAVDLVLNRVSPCQIEEKFGSYSVSVRKSSENGSEESNLLVHVSQQSSCPTLDGYMMVLSLNLNSTMKWFFDEEGNLELQIQLRPIQQMFTEENQENVTENILRRVVSIMFSFHESSRTTAKTTRLSNLASRSRERKTLTRHRRSTSLRPRRRKSDDATTLAGCSLVSYPVNFKQISISFIRYPPSFDVKECSGRCELPLLGHLNSTNHAITMKLEDTHNTSPPLTPTVDCIPTGYSDLQIWEIDEYGTLIDSYLKNMVARHCGCA